MINKFFQISFKFTVLISAILALVHSPELYAQSVQASARKLDAVAFAPYAVWITQLKTQIQNTKIDLTQQINNSIYSNADGSIKFVSERVNLDTHFTSNAVENTPEGMQVNFALEKAVIQLSNFNLVAVVQKDLGFGSATLKLDMHCDAITLNLKNLNPVVANVKVEAGQFVLAQLGWDFQNTTIETQLTGCKEVAGFDQLLKEQIQQNLQQSYVLGSLRQMINERMNPIVNEKIAAQLKTYIQKFKVGIEANHKIDAKNNLWIYSGENLEQVFTADEIQKIEASQKPAILIKKKSLENFAQGSINDILTMNTISSNSYDDMKHLTCSRFVQMFVWPSLKSLSKCFEMKIQTQIKDLVITDMKSLSLGFSLGAWASGEGHQVAYFESGLSAQISQASAQINSFKGQADPDFIKWSGRSKRISTRVLEPALHELLDSTIKKLKQNSVFQLIQNNSNLKPLSADTVLIELNI